MLTALVIAAAVGYGGRLSALSFATLAGYLVLVHSVILFAGLARSLTIAGTATLLTLVLAAALVFAFRAKGSDESPPKGGATRSATGSGLDQPHITVIGRASCRERVCQYV